MLDTNVLVSALGWEGAERQVYRYCRGRHLQMATSSALLGELERVLEYPKFSFTQRDIDGFLAEIAIHAMVVEPTARIELVVDDPEDNRVLECALAADARWIVSGDPHLLKLGEFQSKQILTAAAALSRLG